MIVGYVRVSTEEQNTARQEETLRKYDVEKCFTDKISGKSTDRPALKEIIEFVREGDTVVIESFSRLARNTKDLLELVQIFEDKGVGLISSKESIDTKTPTGRLMLTMIAAISTFERDCLLERQAEGIAIAKANGVYKGRKRVQPVNFEEMVKKYNKREIKTKSELATLLGISRKTLYNLMN